MNFSLETPFSICDLSGKYKTQSPMFLTCNKLQQNCRTWYEAVWISEQFIDGSWSRGFSLFSVSPIILHQQTEQAVFRKISIVCGCFPKGINTTVWALKILYLVSNDCQLLISAMEKLAFPVLDQFSFVTMTQTGHWDFRCLLTKVLGGLAPLERQHQCLIFCLGIPQIPQYIQSTVILASIALNICSQAVKALPIFYLSCSPLSLYSHECKWSKLVPSDSPAEKLRKITPQMTRDVHPRASCLMRACCFIDILARRWSLLVSKAEAENSEKQLFHTCSMLGFIVHFNMSSWEQWSEAGILQARLIWMNWPICWMLRVNWCTALFTALQHAA